MDQNSSKAYAEPANAPPGAAQVALNGNGSPLFVINLCASMAPVQLSGNSLPGLEAYRLYQVSHKEDGRTRYRLRLGFFTSQAAAEGVLATVREKYATAFTTCLSEDDRKFTRGYVLAPAAEPPAPTRPRPAAVAASTPISTPARQAPAVNRARAVVPPARPAVQTASPSTPAPVARTPARPAPAPTVSSAARPAASTAPAKPVVPAPKAATATAPTKKPGNAAVPPAANPANVSRQQPAKMVATAKPTSHEDINEIEISWVRQMSPAAAASLAQAAKTSSPAAAPTPPVKAPALNAGAKNETLSRSKPAMRSPSSTAPVVPEVKNPPVSLKPSAPVKLELETERAAPSGNRQAAQPADRNSDQSQPFHVGKGVEIPQLPLSLQEDPSLASQSMKMAALRQGADPRRPNPVAQSAKAAHPAAPAKPASPSPQEIAKAKPRPDVDSTQTIRALTSEELNDEQLEKWFSIQLAESEQPVNLDAMPHLDIFEAYRLYSIACANNGKISHSLRLGFFREAVSAEAVAGYLRTFFASPSVVRISAAEHQRFKDEPTSKAPATTEKNESKVIDLSQARDRGAAKPVIPTITMEVPPQRRPADGERSPTGSFKVAADRSPSGNFKAPADRNGATGSFRTTADRSPTGTFKKVGEDRNSSTGSFKVAADSSSSGKYPAAPNHSASGRYQMAASGKYRVLKPSVKPAAKAAQPATKRSAPVHNNHSQSGKYRTSFGMSLQDQLLEEAREVELSASGIRRMPKLPKNDSLFSRLVDKLKK